MPSATSTATSSAGCLSCCGNLCATCADPENYTRIDQYQGCGGEDNSTTDGDYTNAPCFAQTFTNPWSDSSAILVFDGWADHWLSIDGNPVPDEWGVIPDYEVEFAGHICIGLDPAGSGPGDSVTIAVLNNQDPTVEIHGDVYICKGIGPASPEWP